MITLSAAQQFVHQQALDLLLGRNGVIAWDIEAVLCEDDRTVMIYCQVGDGEWLAASFDPPRGSRFDAAEWERKFAAGFASVTALKTDKVRGVVDLAILSQVKSVAA